MDTTDNQVSNNKTITIIGLYYLALLLIAISWTNRDMVEPNRVLRILFTIAYVLPLIRFPNLTVVVFAVFYSIRLFSISPFGYLPTEDIFYLIIAIVAYIATIQRGMNLGATNRLFVIFLFIAIFANLINYSERFVFARMLLTFILLTKLAYTHKDVNYLEFAFIIVTFCLSIYGLIFYKDFILSTVITQNSERTFWNDPNYLGCMLSIGIVISFFYFLSRKKQHTFFRILCVVTAILGLTVLGLLASRGAFFAAIIPMFYLIIRNFKSASKEMILISFIVIMALLFTNLLFLEPLKERFLKEDFLSGSGRMAIWRESFKLFAQSPFYKIMFGGGSEYAYQISGRAFNSVGLSPHNNFLEVFYDYGIFGLLVFIGMIFSWTRDNWKNVLGLTLILVFVLSSLTLSPLMYLPFWFLLVLVDIQKYKEDV